MNTALSDPVYFGGPDLTKNNLRDTLLQHIQNTPPKGTIAWVCYYFNEPVLLEALIEAANRGTQVELIIEDNPRCTEINQQCIYQLESLQHPLINITRFSSTPLWQFLGINWHGHLHSKLYFFSHPEPHALIGSYNPTADIAHLGKKHVNSIGDHSISHNLLVEISNKEIVTLLLSYINSLKKSYPKKLARFSQLHNQTYSFKTWEISFLPRWKSHPVNRVLLDNNESAEVKCAISHLKGPGVLKLLGAAKKHGKNIELLLESSKRRIPEKNLLILDKHGIKYYQTKNTDNALMHNKFIIYESRKASFVMFGSFNWSVRSRWLNHEIIACSSDEKIVNAFKSRWKQIVAQI